MTENINNYMLSDEELEQVVGGARRTVHNDENSYILIYDGPNGEANGKVSNGEYVNITGRRKYSNGYMWYELENRNWIIGSDIGY